MCGRPADYCRRCATRGLPGTVAGGRLHSARFLTAARRSPLSSACPRTRDHHASASPVRITPVKSCAHVRHRDHTASPRVGCCATALSMRHSTCAKPPSPRHAQPDCIGGGHASRQMMQHVPGAGSVGGRPKSRDAYRYRSSPHSARACVFARVFARVFACVCACADILRDSLLYVCSCLWMWTAACAYTHAPQLTYACVHTHTHTQTHTWIYVWALPTQARMQRCAAHSPPARALESAREWERAHLGLEFGVG